MTLNPARLARFADWARTLPPRPLPRTAIPVPGEYYLDYTVRLAGANHLELAELTAALEATLRLHHHEPGALAAQTKYLHQRTGGMIGSLTHLIRGAAIRAILGGQEAITRPLLDTVRIDHAAESATRRSSSTR